MRALDQGGPADRPFRPFPEAWLERPAAAVFAEVAARDPGKVAVDDGVQAITYGGLERLAGALAAALRALPGDPARPVGIALPTGARFPAAMLAALACGRPYLPLDAGFPEERNAQLAAHAGLGAVIADRATLAAARRIAPGLPVVLADEPPPEGAPLEVAAGPDDPAYILYTSGSTGRPKGVVQDQRGLLHDVMQYVASAHLDASDRLTQLYSPSVNGAIRDVYGALLTGATLLPVDLRREGLRRLRGLLLGGEVTVLHAMPPVFRAVHGALAGAACPPALRLVYMAGDRIFAGDAARFRAATAPGTLLYVGIGSTENATIYRQWFIGHRTPLDGELVPVGYPVPGRASVLLGEDGAPVPPGEVGEIVVTSRHVALGYWNEPELTAAAFRPSPDDPRARVLRTGDLGRERPDGLLEFVGRRDRQLKIRGYRVEPAETEAALRAVPGVEDAAVIPRADGTGLAAFVAPAGLDPGALADRLARVLPAHQRPHAIRVLPALPTLPNLKHDLAALAALDAGAGAARGPAAPPPGRDEDGTAAAVRAAWEEVLGPGSCAPARAFAEAGGDSLELLRFLFALEERLGRPVPADAVGLGATPSDIAARLAAPVAAAAGAPALFVVPGTSGARLADLRLAAALAPAFRAELVPLPPLEEEWRRLPSIDELARACAARVATRAPDGPVSLLGVSFGARVAWGAAALLAGAGREVAFLGIGDIAPRAGPGSLPDAASSARRYLAGPHRTRRLAVRCYQELVYQCVRRGAPAAGRASSALAAALVAPRRRVSVTAHTLGAIRRAKIPDWRPPRLAAAVPVTLFKSAGTARRLAGLPDDLGWGAWCHEVRVVPVEGDHGTYATDHLDGFARRVVEAARPGAVLPLAA